MCIIQNRVAMKIFAGCIVIFCSLDIEMCAVSTSDMPLFPDRNRKNNPKEEMKPRIA